VSLADRNKEPPVAYWSGYKDLGPSVYLETKKRAAIYLYGSPHNSFSVISIYTLL